MNNTKTETAILATVLATYLLLALASYQLGHNSGITHGRLKQCERTLGCNMEALKAELYDEMNGDTK